MGFSEEQLKFLKDEFGLDEDTFFQMDANQWEDIREKCFDIEVGAVMDSIDEDGKENPLSERGNIAVSIIDHVYDEVFPLLKSQS